MSKTKETMPVSTANQPMFKTQYNTRLFNKWAEDCSAPGKTRPDQSMTVDQLVKRYASGLPYSGIKTPFYLSDDHPFSGVEWDKMDLVDKEQFMKSAKEKYNQALKEVKAQQAKQRQDELEKKITKEVEFKLRQDLGQGDINFAQVEAQAKAAKQAPPSGAK